MHMKLCRLLLPLALAFLPIATPTAMEQRIAAIVNDDVVSLQDLNDRLGLVLMTSRIPDDERARTRLSQQILRGLVEETLQLQEAKRLSIGVEQNEIDRALVDIAQRNKLEPAQLQEVLAKNNINAKTLLDQIRAQISWIKVVNQRIRPQVNVTVDQLEIAVQEARLKSGPARNICYPKLPCRLTIPAMSSVWRPMRSASCRRFPREPVSMLWRARSPQPRPLRIGGDLGWVQESKLPPELIGALERLRPGDVSQPLRSPVGFFIFQLRDRRLGTASSENGGNDDAEDEIKLSQILFEADIKDDKALSQRADEAQALRQGLTDCEAVNATAEELSAPASGDLGLAEDR